MKLSLILLWSAGTLALALPTTNNNVARSVEGGIAWPEAYAEKREASEARSVEGSIAWPEAYAEKREASEARSVEAGIAWPEAYAEK